MIKFDITKNKTSIDVNNSLEGEAIETKILRIMTVGEPIKDGAPLVYTERKDGVRPEYNIRTDRFEIAIEAMDRVTKTHIAKREERQAKIVEMNSKKDGGAEPIHTTNN